MEHNTILTDVGQEYAAAYDVHYTEKDMHEAFVLYGRLIAAHPDTQEAKYSRSQVQNIVNAVVPKQEIMDALQKLALTHFEQDVPQAAKSA
jgi:hypothetical protein